MASAPPEIVGQILSIPIAQIVVGDRLRPIDPVWSAALGSIMAAEGQKTPIEVCQLPGRRDYLLVAGGHRFDGARLQGWRAIKAILVDANAIERREREISENLWRKGLDPIDRATFVAELYAIQRLKAGVDEAASAQQVAIQARWSKVAKADADDTRATIARVYGWADDVADKVGLSRRSIYNDLALHRRLLPDVVAALRGHPIAGNAAQLQALTKLSDADQRSVVALIISGTAKGVSDGLGVINQKPTPSPDVKVWSAFFGSWSRMSAAKRMAALRELAEQGLPKGVRIEFDEENAGG
jgi:ParB family chromosome partitioning protein